MKWARLGASSTSRPSTFWHRESDEEYGPGSPRDPELLPRARQAESLSKGLPRTTVTVDPRGGEMEQILERCAALDVRKRQLTACARVPDRAGKRAELRAEFDLLALR